jgi:hypothetical protein
MTTRYMSAFFAHALRVQHSVSGARDTWSHSVTKRSSVANQTWSPMAKLIRGNTTAGLAKK